MTSDHDAFRAAIDANPEDQAPWGVYADYLDEQGMGRHARAARHLAREIARGKYTVFNDSRSPRQGPRLSLHDYGFFRIPSSYIEDAADDLPEHPGHVKLGIDGLSQPFLIHADGRSQWFDSDWSHPGLASSFGWQACPHGDTDGTVDCPHRRRGDMIAEAHDFLRQHEGEEIPDSGYFEPERMGRGGLRVKLRRAARAVRLAADRSETNVEALHRAVAESPLDRGRWFVLADALSEASKPWMAHAVRQIATGREEQDGRLDNWGEHRRAHATQGQQWARGHVAGIPITMTPRDTGAWWLWLRDKPGGRIIAGAGVGHYHGQGLLHEMVGHEPIGIPEQDAEDEAALNTLRTQYPIPPDPRDHGIPLARAGGPVRLAMPADPNSLRVQRLIWTGKRSPAYRLVEYTPTRQKDGSWVYRRTWYRASGGARLRNSYPDVEVGALHGKPVPPEVLEKLQPTQDEVGALHQALVANPLDRATWGALSDKLAEIGKPSLGRFAKLMSEAEDDEKTALGWHGDHMPTVYRRRFTFPISEPGVGDPDLDSPLYTNVAGRIAGIPVMLHHQPKSGFTYLHVRSHPWPESRGLPIGITLGARGLGEGLLHEIDQPEDETFGSSADSRHRAERNRASLELLRQHYPRPESTPMSRGKPVRMSEPALEHPPVASGWLAPSGKFHQLANDEQHHGHWAAGFLGMEDPGAAFDHLHKRGWVRISHPGRLGATAWQLTTASLRRPSVRDSVAGWLHSLDPHEEVHLGDDNWDNYRGGAHEVARKLYGAGEQFRRAVRFAAQKDRPVSPQTAQTLAASSNQQTLLQTLKVVLDQSGLTPNKVYPAVHEVGQQARASAVAAIFGERARGDGEYGAAWQGLVAKQPSLVVFRSHPEGPDSVYRFAFRGPQQAMSQLLDRVGVQNRVYVPHGGVTHVFLYDQGRALRERVGQLAGKLGLTAVEHTGEGRPVGGGDDMGRGAYRDEIRQAEQPVRQARVPQGYGGRWPGSSGVSHRDFVEWLGRKRERPVDRNKTIHLDGDGNVRVRLYGTDVVISHPNGTYTLNAGHYHTPTTQGTIRRFTGYRASFAAGSDFYNGLRVTEGGQRVAGYTPNPEQTRRLEQQVFSGYGGYDPQAAARLDAHLNLHLYKAHPSDANELALHDRIKENEDDHAPWLVYADWLTEHGREGEATTIRKAFPPERFARGGARAMIAKRIRGAIRMAKSTLDENVYDPWLRGQVRKNLMGKFGYIPDKTGMEQIDKQPLTRIAVRQAGSVEKATELLHNLADPEHNVYKLYDPKKHPDFAKRFFGHMSAAPFWDQTANQPKSRNREATETQLGYVPGEGEGAMSVFDDRRVTAPVDAQEPLGLKGTALRRAVLRQNTEKHPGLVHEVVGLKPGLSYTELLGKTQLTTQLARAAVDRLVREGKVREVRVPGETPRQRYTTRLYPAGYEVPETPATTMDQVIGHARAGKNVSQIGRLMGLTRQAVRSALVRARTSGALGAGEEVARGAGGPKSRIDLKDVVRHFNEGKKNPEIAQALGVSEGYASMLVRKARAAGIIVGVRRRQPDPNSLRQRIAALAAQGKKSREIAEALGIKESHARATMHDPRLKGRMGQGGVPVRMSAGDLAAIWHGIATGQTHHDPAAWGALADELDEAGHGNAARAARLLTGPLPYEVRTSPVPPAAYHPRFVDPHDMRLDHGLWNLSINDKSSAVAGAIGPTWIHMSPLVNYYDHSDVRGWRVAFHDNAGVINERGIAYMPHDEGQRLAADLIVANSHPERMGKQDAWTPVSSSWIAELGRLAGGGEGMWTRTGKEYDYPDLTQAEGKSWFRSASKGKWFNRFLRARHKIHNQRVDNPITFGYHGGAHPGVPAMTATEPVRMNAEPNTPLAEWERGPAWAQVMTGPTWRGGYRVRDISDEGLLSEAKQLGVIAAMQGRPRATAMHGGTVAGSYGYRAYTGGAVMVGLPDGRVVVRRRHNLMNATGATLTGAARNLWPSLANLFHGSASDRSRQLALEQGAREAEGEQHLLAVHLHPAIRANGDTEFSQLYRGYLEDTNDLGAKAAIKDWLMDHGVAGAESVDTGWDLDDGIARLMAERTQARG